jgi:type VI secretion system secreted protein Hcp
VAVTAANAAENIHVAIKGQKTGDIQGDNADGTIAGLASEHSIVSPRDPASGLPTGRRQHKPFTIVKSLDKSTPLLYQVLVTNENLPTVTLKFYKPAVAGGKPVVYYTVTLTNASISSIRDWKPNTRDLSADRAGDLEEVSFTYQKITWTYADGGVTAEDDWEAPVN